MVDFTVRLPPLPLPVQVLLIPGDTFRAAAAEQLAEWGRRAGATMGSFREGARPQAVIAEVRACAEFNTTAICYRDAVLFVVDTPAVLVLDGKVSSEAKCCLCYTDRGCRAWLCCASSINPAGAAATLVGGIAVQLLPYNCPLVHFSVHRTWTRCPRTRCRRRCSPGVAAVDTAVHAVLPTPYRWCWWALPYN